MKFKHNFWFNFEILIPILLGLVSIYVIAGPEFINIKNIAWIRDGDPAQQYLGWEFFRQAPWGLPLGLNPNYGLDISSSIVYSDSIPLLAIVFKIFSSFLPTPFQYFGIWTVFCFVLQSVFAWKLIRIFSPNIYIQIFSTILFNFAPALMWRVGFHTYATSHFLILAALYLSLMPAKISRLSGWAILLFVTIGVNFYIFIMVFILYIAYLLDNIRVLEAKGRVFVWAMTIFAGLLFEAWLIGYFVIWGESLAPSAYGNSRMNVLAFFNSAGWSYILPRIPYSYNSDYESFNFIGLGFLVLLFFILIKISLINRLNVNKIFSGRYFLLASAIGLAIFAITNTLSIGPYNFVIPVPEWLLSKAAILRSSGRMIWPAYYLLLLSIIVMICKLYSNRNACILIILSAFLQIGDTSSGWLVNKTNLKVQRVSDTNNLIFSSSPFWIQAKNHYSNIITSTPQKSGLIPEGWESIAKYAISGGLGTNAVYLARIDSKKYADSRDTLREFIYSGRYPKNSLFLVQENELIPIMHHLDGMQDLLTKIDGSYILAPGWMSCNSCLRMSSLPNPYLQNPIRIPSNKKISFAKGGNGVPLLTGVGKREIVGWGWSYPEDWGVWADGNKALLVLPVAGDGTPQELKLKFKAFITKNHPKQIMNIYVDDKFYGNYNFSDSGVREIPIKLEHLKKGQDFISLELAFENFKSPLSLGLGDDVRQLSVGLIEVDY